MSSALAVFFYLIIAVGHREIGCCRHVLRLRILALVALLSYLLSRSESKHLLRQATVTSVHTHIVLGWTVLSVLHQVGLLTEARFLIIL